MFYFTPLQGFYFTFPSRYYFTISYSKIFSLTRWSSLIHTRFHVSDITRVLPMQNFILDFHHLWYRIQLFQKFIKIVNPTTLAFTSLGCFRFARRYYENRVCFLFLQLLRCFNSLSYLFFDYEFIKKFLRLFYSGTFRSSFISNSLKYFVGNDALLRF